jgi:hypothetical protein
MVSYRELLSLGVFPGVFFLIYITLYFNWEGGYCDTVPKYIGAAPRGGGWLVSASDVPSDLSSMVPTGYPAVDLMAWYGHSLRLTILYHFWGAECYILNAWGPAGSTIDPVQ